jgi:hypothetical protein
LITIIDASSYQYGVMRPQSLHCLLMRLWGADARPQTLLTVAPAAVLAHA